MVTDAFRQASNQVLDAEIPRGDKGKIEKQLRGLEKELLKAPKADLAAVQKEWEWINKNASWLSATVAPAVLESVKISLNIT